MDLFFGALFWIGFLTSIISAFNSHWNLAFLCALGILMMLLIWIGSRIGEYIIFISQDLKKLIKHLEDKEGS